MTAFFNLFIFLILFNGFNARTEKFNLLENISKNPGFLQVMAIIAVIQVIITLVGDTILRATPLRLTEWAIVLLIASSIIPVDLVKKWIIRKTGRQSYL